MSDLFEPLPAMRSPDPQAGGREKPFNPLVREDGELRPTELFFRLGLLLGAFLFLAEGQGAPWNRSWPIIAAAVAMAALIVLTMTLQWRVLGDWRRATQRLVLAALVLVLAVPLTAVISPQLAASALPEVLRTFLTESLSTIQRIPGLGAALSIVHGVIVFLFYMLVLVVLMATSGAGQRLGFALVGAGVAGLGLFLHPTPETVVGLVLLGFFFRVQWEKPLLVPDRLRPHLSDTQLQFLRELTEQGALSPGEARLYLDQDAAAFGELLEYRLVEYDSFVREVLPGQRLLHDPACAALENGMGLARRGFWFLAGITYLLTPDLIPGPVDDIIVMLLCSGAGLNWFSALLGKRRVMGRRRF